MNTSLVLEIEDAAAVFVRTTDIDQNEIDILFTESGEGARKKLAGSKILKSWKTAALSMGPLERSKLSKRKMWTDRKIKKKTERMTEKLDKCKHEKGTDCNCCHA